MPFNPTTAQLQADLRRLQACVQRTKDAAERVKSKRREIAEIEAVEGNSAMPEPSWPLLSWRSRSNAMAWKCLSSTLNTISAPRQASRSGAIFSVLCMALFRNAESAGVYGVAFALPEDWRNSIKGIRPWSTRAGVLALACLGAATLLRIIVGWLGASAPFSTFFPAVLVTALLAGTPAAVAVIVASVLVAWWTFLPPTYEFNPLTAMDIANIAIFVISSGLIVVVAQFYRSAIQQLQARNNERDLLMRELEHRGRNTYTIVEAIVRNTLAPDREKADIIAARVRAVSSANDLVNWASTRRVPLRKLLALAFGANAERISVSGREVELSPAATRTLSLVFHELLTNAMKYGALSGSEGSIAIDWVIESGQIHLTWVEAGGPAVVEPDRIGFGTTVITQSLAALSGNVVFAFQPSGLRCTVQFNPNA